MRARTRYPTSEVLQEIARLRHELTEPECRARAERMAHQQSAQGRSDMVLKLREGRKHIAEKDLQDW